MQASIANWVNEMKPGQDFGWLYDSILDIKQILPELIRVGTQRNNRLVIALPETLQRELGDIPETSSLEQFQSDNSLEIYLGKSADSPSHLIEILEKEVCIGQENDHTGLMIIIDLGALLPSENQEPCLFEYEMALAKFCQETQALVVWMMEARIIGFGTILAALASHPRIILGHHLNHSVPILPSAEMIGSGSLGLAAYRLMKSLVIQRQVEHVFGTEDQWFRNIFDQVYQLVAVLTPEGMLIEINPAGLQYGGVQRRDVVGIPFWETPWWKHSKESKDELIMAIQKAAQGEFVRYETQLSSAAGVHLDFDLSLRPITDPTGQIVYIIAEARDVTEKKKDQKLLLDRERLIEVAVAGAPITLFMVGLDGVVRFSIGKGALRNQPYGTEAAGRLYTEAYSDVPLAVENIRRAMQGESFNSLVEVNGQIFNVHYSPYYGEKGQLAGVVGVGTDITSSRQAEDALQASQARYRLIFEKSGIGIVIKDLEGKVTEANPAFCEMLGYPIDELLHKTFYDLTYPADLVAALDLFNTLFTGKRVTDRLQKRYLRKDGQVIWAEIIASVLRGPDNQPVGALEMVEDISLKKQMEAELIEVQRRLMQSREMERLHLAQDLHDGPLQELYGISYSLRSLDGTRSMDEIHAELTKVEVMLQRQIQTLRTLCGELRPPTLAPFGLEKAIQSHAETFENTHANIHVRLELMHDGQLIPEKVRLALFRIYQELLNNVARHSGASEIIVRLKLTDEVIILEIEDNGRGFEVPKRWVEIARQGHLGLVGVVERAESVGGQMKISSHPGEGTVASVTVPRTFQDEIWNFDSLYNETMEK